MVIRKQRSAHAIERVDSLYLESLVGYNTRRATLVIVERFLERMTPYALKPVEFSVLSLVARNPGITSRQLCAALNIRPPNLVSLVGRLQRRGLITRRPHPHDGRAVGLLVTPQGRTLTRQAEATATQLELEATSRLTEQERRTLMALLQKIYLPPAGPEHEPNESAG